MGGSHAAFLESWTARSAHRVEVMGLAPRHWRWRMRSAPWEFARRLERADRTRPDVLFVTDYVDLPALRGMLPPSWADVPTIAYFHENQLTYPEADGVPRDGHLGWTNLVTCLRADALVFNSKFHAREFRVAGEDFLAALPRPSPRADFAAALDRAQVIPPGIDWHAIPLGRGGDGPLRVLFPHRFEHDKQPLRLLRAVRDLLEGGAELELVLLGERATKLPDGLGDELEALTPAIAHDGYLPSRDDYLALVGSSDLVVSTADHEFYGIAVAEALASGCAPLLPNRLAYPEVLPIDRHAAGLYADAELLDRLRGLAGDPSALRSIEARRALRDGMRTHDRAHAVARLDRLAEELTATPHNTRHEA